MNGRVQDGNLLFDGDGAVAVLLEYFDDALTLGQTGLGVGVQVRAELGAPFTLCSPADVKGEDVLRILLYQDRQQLPIQALLEKALGDNAAMLRSERTGMDVMVLTPGAVSAEAMLGAVCLPVNCTADQLTVAAGCSQMLELVRQAKQSVVPADAPVELRLAASQTTLTDHDTGAAAEFFYGLVRSAEAAS